MTKMTSDPIRVGIAGLGMAGAGILNGLSFISNIEVVAAADQREHALGAFQKRYQGRTYDDFDRLCEDPDIDAVWVATPSHLHCEHVIKLAKSGKHIVVEKPMAIDLDECLLMVEAAEENNVTLIAGGARSFDPAFVEMSRIIRSGRLGRLGGLATWSFTGWMTRAREPHELDPARDGGCLFNQGPHPIDVLRLLGGGVVKTVRGSAVDLDLPGRPGPGYFQALLEFDDGTPASLLYNGYGYIEGWELVPWGETDQRLAMNANSTSYRQKLRAGTADDAAARELLRYGGRPEGGSFGGSSNDWIPLDAGLVVATCELGEIRQSATGLYVYDDHGRHDERLPDDASSRMNEVKELLQGMAGDQPLHSGRWGAATMEVVLAIQESSRNNTEVQLTHQVPVRQSG